MELNLCTPWSYKSDKQATMKGWGTVIKDKNSGAVHCDMVLDYSAQEVIKMLRRFGSLRGWTAKISSYLGSKLESASGGTGALWKEIS